MIILLIVFCSILKVFDLLKTTKKLLKWWKSFVPEDSTYNYCFYLKSSTWYFHIKAKILADFKTCISAPLSDTGRVVSDWDWQDCFEARLVRLFPSETAAIVPGWLWHNFSQMSLARLFPSETGTVLSKWK